MKDYQIEYYRCRVRKLGQRVDELTEHNRQLREVIKAFRAVQPSTASLAVFLCHECGRATDTVYQFDASGGQFCADCFACEAVEGCDDE